MVTEIKVCMGSACFAKGNQENFVLRNNNMRNANAKPVQNNPVMNALNRNMFKR